MDEELLALQKQFEFAQQVKSSIRLSDRNIVELVQKLHDLQIIDFDLLHTVSGKEYITPVLLPFHLFLITAFYRLYYLLSFNLDSNIVCDRICGLGFCN